MGRDLRSGRSGGGAKKFPDEESVKKYSGMSENQLMNELFSKVQRGRSDGSLSDGDLDAYLQQLSPMLSPQQRIKMKGLIDMMKGNG